MIILRPDQQNLKDSIYHNWNNGTKHVLGVLSTGGGKSVIASDIVLDGARLGIQQVVIAHRNELVSQMSMHVANRGIPHRIIGSDSTVRQITAFHRKNFGQSFVNPSARTAVIGVDTLVSRHEKLKNWAAQTSQWIIDEAHHVLRENKWGKAVAMFPNARGLGITATPLRADGKGLGCEYEGVFDVMCVGIGMRQLIDIGALADYEIVCPASDIEVDLAEIGTTGDWSSQKLKKAAKKSHIVGDVVEAYQRYGNGKQAICFATDVETAGDIAANFNSVGIRAAALSAETNFLVREKYISEFRQGTLTVLVNVDLFDEGFDVPACEVVIMARPTASLGKYRQMVGRALRVWKGKLHGLIIDHVSNVIRHGLPDKHIEWTLARRDKRGKQERDPDEIPLRVCVGCAKPYERFLLQCPYCGSVPPLPAPRDRSIDMVDGDLVLLDKAALDEMRRATMLETPQSIAERVHKAAGAAAAMHIKNKQIAKIIAQEELKYVIAQWAAIERQKGLSDREIDKKFYLTTNIDILTALSNSDNYEILTKRIRGWYERISEHTPSTSSHYG